MNEKLTRQDKAINHSLPIQVWELYYAKDLLRGSIIDWIPWWQAKKRFDWHYDFKGQTAHYFICTHDASVSIDAALHWCKLHALGKLQTTTVDLSVCNTPAKQKADKNGNVKW